MLILGSPAANRVQGAYAYTHLTGWYEFKDVFQASKLNGKLIDKDTYFFVDTYDILAAENHTFSVSSPNEVHFVRFVALRNCERRYLPAWTLAELKDAFKKLAEFGGVPSHVKFSVTVKSIEECFNLWGGIPRIAFQEEGSPNYTWERLYPLLSRLEMKELIALPTIEEGTLNLLFHFDVDWQTFELSEKKFCEASARIRGALDAKLKARSDQELVGLIAQDNAGERLMASSYFERLCVKKFSRPECLVYLRKLQLNEGPNNDDNLMGVLTTQCMYESPFRAYSELPPSFTEEQYAFYKPVQPNFPGIDAFMVSPLIVFQYTIRGNRAVDGALFRSLIELLERTDFRAIYQNTKNRASLFYAVPDNRMLDFRLSGPADYLVKCTCTETQPKTKSQILRASRKNPKTETREQSEKQEQSENPWYLQQGLCVFCQCFRFFEFYVLGIPGFQKNSAVDEMLGASVCIQLILNPEGKFVEVP